MDILQTVVNYVLNDLGAAVFVPLLMLIIGLLMKMKFSEAFHSALTLGVAFSGMGLWGMQLPQWLREQASPCQL